MALFRKTCHSDI